MRMMRRRWGRALSSTDALYFTRYLAYLVSSFSLAMWLLEYHTFSFPFSSVSTLLTKSDVAFELKHSHRRSCGC